MRTMEVEVAEGVRLRMRHWPASALPPYLLVHGLASNARLWDEVAVPLCQAGHPVYAVDLRSHGESDAPESGYDTTTAAADLAVLLRRLELPPAIVAGQSWGGNVAVRLAARHPELVAGLALVDGGWIDLASQFVAWPTCAREVRPPDRDGMRADGLRSYLHRQHPDWSAAAVEATLANLRIGPGGGLDRRLPIWAHMQILRSMWDDPPGPDFPAVQAPTLLLPALPPEPDA